MIFNEKNNIGMRKIVTFTLALLALTIFANGRNAPEVILHNGSGNNGDNKIYFEPPYVTYDDNLKELTVYFGRTSSIDLEYLDSMGAYYYYVQGEIHASYEIATHTSLPAGYYTVTIHNVYGYTYYGNFTVI